MYDPADYVVEPGKRGKGTVTAFMGDYPQPCANTSLSEAIHRPRSRTCPWMGKELDMQSAVYENTRVCNITAKIGKGDEDR